MIAHDVLNMQCYFKFQSIMLHLRCRNVKDIVPLGVPETPSRMWNRPDTPKVGVLGMSQKLPVGCGTDRTLPRWESLGCPRDSQWDCGTDRTLGQLPRVGVLRMSWGLPMGLWDRQDTGTTAKGGESLGCPRDSQWDCGTDRTLGQLPSVGVLETPGETVEQTGHWDNFKDVGVLGMSWGVPVGLWDIQDTRPTPKTWESLGCPRDSLTIQ